MDKHLLGMADDAPAHWLDLLLAAGMSEVDEPPLSSCQGASQEMPLYHLKLNVLGSNILSADQNMLIMTESKDALGDCVVLEDASHPCELSSQENLELARQAADGRHVRKRIVHSPSSSMCSSPSEEDVEIHQSELRAPLCIFSPDFGMSIFEEGLISSLHNPISRTDCDMSYLESLVNTDLPLSHSLLDHDQEAERNSDAVACRQSCPERFISVRDYVNDLRLTDTVDHSFERPHHKDNSVLSGPRFVIF